MNHAKATLVSLLTVVSLGGLGCGGDPAKPVDDPSKTPPKPTATASATAPPKEDRTAELEKVGARAFVWGYPLVFMERMKRTMTTNVRQPYGTFQHKSKIPTPADAEVLPTQDTLLSSTWVDLQEDGWVLKVPDMGDRYYDLQLVDAYSDVVGHVGRRSTGTKVGQFLITGPGFKGTVPAGMKEIKSPTNSLWIQGRTRVSGDADLPKVTALLKQITLTPLGGKVPALPPPPEARPQDLAFAGGSFFDELGTALQIDAPPATVADWLTGFANAGIGPGLKPSAKLDAKEVDALGMGIKDGAAEIDEAFDKLATMKNGWDVDTRFGKTDREPLVRAAFVKRGLDFAAAEEIFAPLTQVDDGNLTLSGAHEYSLHFDKDKLPPVDAFWSVALYSKKSGNFYENPLKRYSLNDGALKKNKDGSVDVFFQADAPAKGSINEANWLPVPKGEAFFVVVRMYQAKADALNGTWLLPAIKRKPDAGSGTPPTTPKK
ncbi:DUF1254 domain-containing protein [soil metagenome]